jgi:hypothetical protein
MSGPRISGASTLEPLEIREQTERILASPAFRESPIQQRLFRFLIEETLADRCSSLKEYTIGEAVFQRGAGFDPRTDSIVRVQMSVLRKKLATYFETAGVLDPIRVEIPRGHYMPVLSAIPPPSLPQTEPPLTSPRPAKRPGTPAMWGAAGVLIGAVAALLVFRTPAPKASVSDAQRASIEWRDHPLWKGFIGPDAKTRLIIGAPLFIDLGDGLLLRDTTVNRPEDIPASERIRRLNGYSRRPLPMEVYTGLGEAVGISLLGRFFRAAGQDLPLIRNHLTKWQDLTDGNVIFLSSLRFRTLGQDLKRPSYFEFVPISGVGTAVRNLHPEPGEESMYQVSVTHETGYDYALVRVWPGTLAGRQIMAVGGSYTWGTEGAVVYITDPESLRVLRTKLNNSGDARSASLEILLRVQIEDAQVVSTNYVTHHWMK